eukprot:TRINITY_DN4242_c0_g1_i5.p1 TRINITY_DN4242_c0_g1~~TRINITY_DN4242_c0_g1_i5.p1  ORF type:complete len:564 (+),score=30.22 TRINITY_DN4242_c0_g1_i5:116-1807(+)
MLVFHPLSPRAHVGLLALCSLLLLASTGVLAFDLIGSPILGTDSQRGFGERVSLSFDGTVVAIGADFSLELRQVRIFRWDGGTWTQMGDNIDDGYSVSLSHDGTRVAIGSPRNGHPGLNGITRVFEWDNLNTVWEQMGGDIAEDPDDYWGYCVSLSYDGTRLAIGAPDTAYSDYTPYARIFDWDGNSWTQLGSDLDGEAVGDYSGYSVSLSSDGTRVAIGAPGPNGWTGHVQIFELVGTTWTQLGSDIDGTGAGDYFGFSVSLSEDGSRVAVGSPQFFANNPTPGYTGVFEWNDMNLTWEQMGEYIVGDEVGNGLEASGYSVSLDAAGSRLAIGAPAPFPDPTLGSTRVFAWSGTSWMQVGEVIYGLARQSGISVALAKDGKSVAVGEPRSPSPPYYDGDVRIFRVSIPSPSPSPTVSASPSPTVSASPSPTVSASPSPAVSASPSPIVSPSPTISASASPSPSPFVEPSGSDDRLFLYIPHAFTYSLPAPAAAVDVTFFDDLRSTLPGVAVYTGPNLGSFSWAPHHVYPTSQGRIHIESSADNTNHDDLLVTVDIYRRRSEK